MLKYLLLLLLLPLSAFADNVTLGWFHVTERDNGDTVLLTDIDHYTVQYGMEDGESISVNVPPTAGCDTQDRPICYTTPNLPPGTYRFTVMVFDKYSNQSPFSESLGMTIDWSMLKAPEGVIILSVSIVIDEPR